MKWSLAVTTIILAFVTLAGCSHSTQGKADVATPRTWTSTPMLDQIVAEGMEKQYYPGAVLIVGQPGRILHSKAYGTKTYGPGSEPMTMDTIFDMASVSKVVGTATAAWVLLDDGKINLDDRVADYIPGFEEGGKKWVTIRDLMTHVSGLKAYESRDKVEEERLEGQTPSDALIRHYAALEVSYPPREKYVYSCLNFQTLARVNEVASGMRQEDLLYQRVYSPLGMRDTRYVLKEDQVGRVAPTHILKDGEVSTWQVHDPLANYHGSDLHCSGNAGLFSTALDLVPYCEMILNGGFYKGRQILSPGIIEMTTSVQTPPQVNEDRGLGWDIYEVKPYMTDLNSSQDDYVIGHTGYTGTMIWIDKHSDTFFIFLTNRTFPAKEGANDQSPDISPMRKKIADTVLRTLPEYEEYFGQYPGTETGK